MNLSTFWKRKKKHTIILKSGKEIVIYAENITVTHKNNELLSYEIVRGDVSLFYCRIDSIDAIVVG